MSGVWTERTMTNQFRQAVVVAAGFGSRLQAMRPGGSLIKPLEPVGGRPILMRVLDGAFAAGIEEAVIVVGHMADVVESTVRKWPVAGPVRFVFNPRYELSNGVSLYHGARECSGDFVLLMSDHLFEGRTLKRLTARGLAGDMAVLAVDHKIADVFDLDDATKVVAEGDRVAQIGKDLSTYNCIDTGMFLLSSQVTPRLEALIQAEGDASISRVMKQLIAERRMGAFDIGDGFWQDVDTPEMLHEAESAIADGRFRE